MKLTGLMKKVFRAIEGTTEARPPGRPAGRRRARIQGDGFEVARRAPVDLGKPPPASAAADRAFVTGLYRDLLGRAPDSAGLEAHLSGLQNGMSRQEIRQVFLDSPELRAKLAAAPIEVPPVQPAPVDPLRTLIAADIKTASGREATEADYDYWLPKLQSPCDSGFVTSGQMTGVEYYHRRMLGWQAGGADQATSGPYAGGSEAHGPVPPATEVMGVFAA